MPVRRALDTRTQLTDALLTYYRDRRPREAEIAEMFGGTILLDEHDAITAELAAGRPATIPYHVLSRALFRIGARDEARYAARHPLYTYDPNGSYEPA
jgi:hypothetical protein